MSDPRARVILAIDPGPEKSGWIVLGHTAPRAFGTWPNDRLVAALSGGELSSDIDAVAIETIEVWGGFVGPPALETMRWVGRFEQAAAPMPVTLLRRSAVIAYLGIGRMPAGKAKLAVRAVLIDRYGGGNPQQRDHVLHGVTEHIMSALAVAVAYQDGAR